MSLNTSEEGILGTPVTWEEFEKNLRSSLKTDATFGPNKTVVDIGDGKGFASCTGMIDCDWVGAGADEKLPSKVVLKIPSSIPFRKMNDAMPEERRAIKSDNNAAWEAMEMNLRNGHNIEIASYEFFDGFSGLKIPRKYYGTKYTDEEKGYLCVEFMHNSMMMEFTVNYEVDLLKQIARALGQLGACSLQKEPVDPDLHKDMFLEYVEKTFTKEYYCGMNKGLLAWDSSEKTAELIGKIVKLAEEYYASNITTTLHKQMGFPPVLVNGDCKTGNVLIDIDSGNLLSLIDWASTHLGVGVEDLIRISLFSLSAETRRESTGVLIEEMYDGMVEKLDGAKAPYTLDQLKTIYDLVFPHCALFFAGFAPMILKKFDNDTTLSSEKKDEIIKLLMGKCLGALEDVLVIHEKNKEIMKTLKFRME
ncbi:hypothetical protein PFISCL1PPCAC_21968 [Pristionchus fissidentatus]|uniref:CHK kinase-like domain-containing protein n=1 Tax=Pristionchus fissidentatus TaxID=1538716 RepID=A0AAV5WFG8_9BILA|nr:hypothetical protein PFISCL1PPCAC_21968 [Pristionchus fissidentatus]